uniref:Uncharacterized protein n=1 Tax=Takifugu rubripes TaxID=31033 RepID=Q8AX92_TAKRU|nr:hypothetical protein [Takifugu rubripes]
MGQLEELKLFISERLHAVTAEILGAIEKAITDYEDQASPLKEENGHHLPMLDTVVKSSIPKTEGVEASSCTGAADPFIPSHPNPPFESEEAAVDSNDLQFLFTSYASFLKYATSAANGSCLYCLKYVEASETHLMKRHYLKAVHFILDGTDADHSCVFFEETALNSETCRQPLQLSSTCQRPSLQLKTEAGGREMLKPASHPEVRVKHPQTQEGTSNTRRQVQEDDPLYPASSVCVVGYSEHPSQNTHVESSTEFLSNFPTRDFQSERVSRVCIVVLEEVEEDEPSPSPPPPQTKSSPERRSHPVCRKAATHQDKPSLLRAIFNVDPEEVRSLILKKEDVNVQDNEKRTPLHAAAYLGDAEIIELLILSGARVNAKDNKWLTPLHRAVASCSEDAVAVLLKHSADVNARDKNWQTPLHVAASNKAVRCAEALVPLLSNVNVSDRAGRTALHHAAFSGHVEVNEVNAYGNTPLHLACYNGQDVVVGELIQAGAKVNQENERGFSPLHFASSSRQGALCQELLLTHGAHINMQSKDNRTPLHMAATHGRFSCSQALIQNGADIDCEDKNRNTALHIAARQGHELIITALIKHGANSARRGVHGMFPLHLAALSGFSDCCRKLLSSGFDIDTPDEIGRTCLHAAAAGGNLECLNLLLKIGADFNRKDNFGRTPLHYASANCNYQCVFALVGSGASVNVLDQRGCNPLHYAAAADTEGKGHQDCVALLLHHGASPMTRDYAHKKTAIHAAAMNGHQECLRLLMSHSQHLDVDAQDINGQTPLMLAVLNGHTECVYSLLSQGASVENQDRWGRTALHRGVVTGQEECVEALLQRGANVCVKDIQGRSPLHLASACGRVGALGALLQASSTSHAHLTDNQGYTPLHWACYNGTGYDSCVEVLLDQEVFKQIKGNSFSPLHCAVINDNEGVAEMLIESMGTNIINTSDSKGRTPLHAAAFSDHVECVSLLLSHGAQANVADTRLCRTPLMMAALNGQTNTVEVLVNSAKVDLTLQDAHRNTALHLACSKGHETCALLILEKIGDRNLINCTNAALQTPLHVAARRGLTVVVQELLGKEASVLAVDENGYTPALSCTPNRDVADCLALILNSMMPTSPMVTIAALPAISITQTVINHHPTNNHISKGVGFDALPPLRPNHASYCRAERPLSSVSADEELNDSDSETY